MAAGPALVLPDTNVFAAYLGRGDRPLRDALDRLIRARRVRVAPPVRFEVLRGIRRQAQFDYVRGLLTAFGGAELRASDWDEAAGLARAAAASPANTACRWPTCCWRSSRRDSGRRSGPATRTSATASARTSPP